MKENERKQKSDYNAELVNGNHLGGLSHLQRLIIAKPRSAGGQPGQDEEEPAFAADLPQPRLGAGEEHHSPGKGQHDGGADEPSKLYVWSTRFGGVMFTLAGICGLLVPFLS